LPENASPASVAPVVPTDPAAASARKAELLANPEFRGKFLENDAAARAEMSALNGVIVGPTPADTEPVNPAIIERAREMGVSDDVVAQIEARTPVSQEEYDKVLRWKNGKLKDPAFLRKYLDGDYDARQQMFLSSVVLSSPIKKAT
jgi:hypothetical protein